MAAGDRKPTTTRPRAVSAPLTSRPGPRVLRSRSTLVAIGLHVVLIALLAKYLIVPFAFGEFYDSRRAELRPERIIYMAVPQPPAPVPAAEGRSGGDDRPFNPDRTAEPGPPLVAPTTVPRALPPAPEPGTATRSPGAGGSGPLIGDGGPVRGVRPSYGDARIWGGADAVVAESQLSSAQRLDSALKSHISTYVDSVRAYAHTPGKFERGDWTVGEDGNKWGIDNQYIRLGKVSIPTALLALLPLNNMPQRNPIAYERERALAAMRADINYNVARAMSEDDFRKAVKAIRERKDRERERERARRGGPVVASPDDPLRPD